MPIYEWECENCKKKEDLLKKTFDESNIPPEEESDDNCKEHKWKRLMSKFRLTRGANWTGSKGSWLIFAAFLVGGDLVQILCI